MKTIKESILNSSSAGKRALINKWCEDNNIFDGKFKINNQNEIEYTGISNYPLILFGEKNSRNKYDILPEYIQFADFNGTVSCANGIDIKSFRGLPRVCSRLILWTDGEEIKDLNVKCKYMYIHAENLKSCKNSKIELDGGHDNNATVEFANVTNIICIPITGANIIECKRIATYPHEELLDYIENKKNKVKVNITYHSDKQGQRCVKEPIPNDLNKKLLSIFGKDLLSQINTIILSDPYRKGTEFVQDTLIRGLLADNCYHSFDEKHAGKHNIKQLANEEKLLFYRVYKNC